MIDYLKNKSTLVVVAHPDDEVLGCGGLISKITKLGGRVNLCILSGNVTKRKLKPSDDILLKNIKRSCDILGINKENIRIGNFQNLAFNTIPHYELVEFIEKAIIDFKSNIIITHHSSDLNVDHSYTSLACQTAIRIFQRKSRKNKINLAMFMEVPSATDWGIHIDKAPFIPNCFIDIEKSFKSKLKALKAYKGVGRKFPHPRSDISITSLAKIRGSESGLKLAESFQIFFSNFS